MSARRRLGEEKLYYSPPALRRINQQRQKQKELNSKPPISSTSTSTSTPASVLGRRKSELGSDEKTNLDQFLEHTIPFVPAQHFPRTSMMSWRNRDGDFNPYFILGDLWEFFREWSAYGAAVPLVLNGSDAVVQYYVPYLSGVQLYVDPSKRIMEQRETSSDGDSECGTDRVANNAQGYRNHQNTTVRVHNQYAGRNNTVMGSSVYDGDINIPPGLLIFEYFAREVPFHREPLADKMSILASRFPDLKTLKSCELTSSSWISVAWYPIYRIPVGPTLQNVDACFLTFHSLAKPVKTLVEKGHQNQGSSKVAIPITALTMISDMAVMVNLDYWFRSMVAVKGSTLVAVNSHSQPLDSFHTSSNCPTGTIMELTETRRSIPFCKQLTIGLGRCKLTTLITPFSRHTGDSD